MHFWTKKVASITQVIFEYRREKNEKTTTTATTVIKLGLKHSPMSEGSTCIAEPNLEVLPWK